MSNLFTQGLLIAGIGMGLVFLALIFLWGLMAVMARIRFKSDDNGGDGDVAALMTNEEEPASESSDDQQGLRMRAAAVAVAAALGLGVRTARLSAPAPKALSPWQVSRRSGQFSNNSMVTNRKSRGSAR